MSFAPFRPFDPLRAVAGQERFDPDVIAFAAASGATDLEKINDLVVYLKDQSLFTSARIYPLKSAQNAGSGATAFGLGGLTSNNMSLVASPTWGAGGIRFNGTTQYGSIADFLASQTLTAFVRLAHAQASPSTSQVLFGNYDATGNNRSVVVILRGAIAGDPYDMLRSSDGGVVNFESYRFSDSVYSQSDQCLVSQWISGGGRSLWQNKTQRTASLVSGSAQTAAFNSPSSLFFAANNDQAGVASGFADFTSSAALFITGTLTSLQRETITDLINAL